MSFATNTTVNSGPLVIRTALDGGRNNTYWLGAYEHPIAANYIMTTSNNGLIVPTRDPLLHSVTVTSTVTGIGGLFTNVSTNTLSSVSFTTSTAVCSTLRAQNFVTSTLYSAGTSQVGPLAVAGTLSVSGMITGNSSLNTSSISVTGPAVVGGTLLYRMPIVNIDTTTVTLGTTDWWGRHIFTTNSAANTSLILQATAPLPPDGAYLYITNAAQNARTTTIQNLTGGTGSRILNNLATAHVIYNSTLGGWYSVS
jgi:hypothetical protein